MDMVVRHINYFRDLVEGGNEDAKFDWEIEKMKELRKKLLKKVKKYINVSQK